MTIDQFQSRLTALGQRLTAEALLIVSGSMFAMRCLAEKLGNRALVPLAITAIIGIGASGSGPGWGLRWWLIPISVEAELKVLPIIKN